MMVEMKNSRKKKVLLIWILLFTGASLIVGYNLVRQRKEEGARIKAQTGVYKIGDVTVDEDRGKIQFAGQVYKDRGQVQFLVYAHGYKWLEEESAIIAAVKLVDLQRAIALLDWKLWDDLWYRNESEKTKHLLLFLKWDGKEIAAKEVVTTEDALGIGDFIFLGSPYFDRIALEASPSVDCNRCPIFPLEEKTLRKEFEKPSGQSGYEINSQLMPPEGTQVTVIIQISK